MTPGKTPIKKMSSFILEKVARLGGLFAAPRDGLHIGLRVERIEDRQEAADACGGATGCRALSAPNVGARKKRSLQALGRARKMRTWAGRKRRETRGRCERRRGLDKGEQVWTEPAIALLPGLGHAAAWIPRNQRAWSDSLAVRGRDGTKNVADSPDRRVLTRGKGNPRKSRLTIFGTAQRRASTARAPSSGRRRRSFIPE